MEYKQNKVKVNIICPVHGSFFQTPNSHLNGHGCRKCMIENNGWTKTKFINHCNKNNGGLGIFYILKCFNETEEFYKLRNNF